MRPTKIVNAFQKQQIGYARVRQHISIETLKCIHPHAIVQDVVSANALIDDCKLSRTVWGGEALRELVRPIMILAKLRSKLVGRLRMKIGISAFA